MKRWTRDHLPLGREEFIIFHSKINHCSQHTYEKAHAVNLTGMFQLLLVSPQPLEVEQGIHKPEMSWNTEQPGEQA